MGTSRQLLEDFIKRDIENSLVQKDLQIKDIPKELIVGITDEMLLYNPRKLYDFFDEKEIFMTISKNIKFFYSINGVASRGIFDTRLYAEKMGFEEAFKLLDNE